VNFIYVLVSGDFLKNFSLFAIEVVLVFHGNIITKLACLFRILVK
jgi:hypothetical protein